MYLLTKTIYSFRLAIFMKFQRNEITHDKAVRHFPVGALTLFYI